MHRPPPRTLSHNLCFCAKKCLPTLTCSIKMNAKPLPLIIQLQLTLQESTTTCGSFEKETEGERERERWADFLFSCLSVLICADNSSSFLLSWAAVPPPPPPPWRPERPSDRIDSGSLGVARGHACLGVLPTQRATQHTRRILHTYTTDTAAAALFLRSCTFTFLDLLQRKANEPRNQQMKTLEERSTVIVRKNSRVDWPKAKT